MPTEEVTAAATEEATTTTDRLPTAGSAATTGTSTDTAAGSGHQTESTAHLGPETAENEDTMVMSVEDTGDQYPFLVFSNTGNYDMAALFTRKRVLSKSPYL